MKKTLKKATLMLACAAAFLAGCDNGYDCSLNNTAYNRMGFYSALTKERYTHPGPIDVSLMVNGKDSLFINHITDADEISLPMSYTQDIDTVIFLYEDGMRDSLYITHSNEPYYQSMECGTLMFHSISEVEHTGVWMEKAAIKNKKVNFKGNENIKIYFYQ